jgi:phosphatidylserine/phosphatidylglycerophosphate/cardiolipin synthase-like enzyme
VRRMRLITTGVLGNFARVVHANRDRAFRVWIVSPWLRSEEHGQDPLLLLVDALRGLSCTVFLFTRPPEQTWHGEAVELIRTNTRSIVYVARDLHTKLYILECDGFRAAILGSPNLTSRADRDNLEIAVEFRTTVESPTDDIAALITELTEYASSLRGAEGVTLK